MNRIKSLVEKLNIQVANNAPLGQLLTTVQILQNEISGIIKEVEVLGNNGVAIIVPNAKIDNNILNNIRDINVDNAEKEYFELIVNDSDLDEDLEELNDIPSYEEVLNLKNNLMNESYDEATILPNLNVDTPSDAYQINDLKKAISPRDRIEYVRELFRGDEIMFERSISTINNFHTLNQAEYWIQRELKINNGWVWSHPLVQQFEQLIKRRFAQSS